MGGESLNVGLQAIGDPKNIDYLLSKALIKNYLTTMKYSWFFVV